VARAFYLLAFLALIVAGCDASSSQRSRMEGSGTAPSWPALQALQGQDGIATVGMGMGRHGPKMGKKMAAEPRFKDVLDKFEKEPIPSKFATSARETAKKDLVESLRKMAEAGSDDEIKASWEKAQASMKTLNSP
jgi:hypothetical protein